MTEWIALVGAVAAVMAAVLALINSLLALRTARHVQTLHLELNSRLSELIESTDKASYAQGQAAGQMAAAAETRERGGRN